MREGGSSGFRVFGLRVEGSYRLLLLNYSVPTGQFCGTGMSVECPKPSSHSLSRVHNQAEYQVMGKP